MQSSNTIIGMAIIIVLLAVGYTFLAGESAQNDAAVGLISPEKMPQPMPLQPETPAKNENAPVAKQNEHAAVVRSAQEEKPLDERYLPTGLAPEDRVIDPDAEGENYDPDAVPVNIGEYLDPEADPMPTASDVEKAAVNVGAFLDPEADPIPTASGAEEAPRHIGKFIDPDNPESGSGIQSNSGKRVSIGEYIEPDDMP